LHHRRRRIALQLDAASLAAQLKLTLFAAPPPEKGAV